MPSEGAGGKDGSKGAAPSQPTEKSGKGGRTAGAKPTITTPLEKVEARVGDDATLRITAGPETVANVEWFKDNELIREQPRFTQTSDDKTHSLTVNSVEWDDEGIYKCVLINKHGLASCSVEVLVEGAWLIVLTSVG